MVASQKGRILVVDDEQDITAVIKRGLQDAGYQVDTFNDPQQALSHFNGGYYDLLLFDIRMPVMNGFQLYRKIRDKDGNAKVCFMTAFEMYRAEFEKVFPEIDAARFIKKPFTIRNLRRIVDEELEDKTSKSM